MVLNTYKWSITTGDKTMKKRIHFSFSPLRTLVLGGLILTSPLALAQNYAHLMETVISKLPEQKNTAALQELANTNRQAADSWIAGDVDITIRHENDGATGNQGYQSWEVGAGFPIWLSGQSDAKQKLGQDYARMSENQQSLVDLRASKILRGLVWQLKKAKVTVEFNRKNLEQTQALQHLVSQRVDAGESPKFDLLVAQQSVLKVQRQLALADQAYQSALENYRAWTGSDEIPEDLAETQHSQDLSVHPEIVALREQLAVAGTKLELARINRKQNPHLYVGGKTDKSNQMADNTMLVAQVSVPLGINKQSSVAVSEQNRATVQLQVALEKAEQSLKIAQKNAQIKIDQALKTRQLSEEQLKLSEQTVGLATNAYQQGETSIQILLQMKQQFFENKLNYQLSKLDYLQAIADYNQTQGVSLK